jgi:hypothetical protein
MSRSIALLLLLATIGTRLSCAPPSRAPKSPVIEPIAFGSVAGFVTHDGDTAFATAVFLSGTTRHARPDREGWFRFDSVPAGPQEVGFHHAECDFVRCSVFVVSDHRETVFVRFNCHDPKCDVPQSHLSADCPCFMVNSNEQARIGKHCRVHWSIRLRPDTVWVVHAWRGVNAAERDFFPNARTDWDAGDVVTTRTRQRTEVAYCSECRLAREGMAAEAKSCELVPEPVEPARAGREVTGSRPPEGAESYDPAIP